MRSWILFIFFYSAFSFGQDTTANLKLKEVEVNENLLPLSVFVNASILPKKQIEEIQAEDIGNVLQKLEGVAVKSYGGLGGLKTISVRSLGANHSAIVMDGFRLNNHQTGQINLAQIPTNQVEKVEKNVGSASFQLIPATAMLSANSIQISTFDKTFPTEKQAVRVGIKYGSFAQLDTDLAVKFKLKKTFVSASGKFRQAKGNYPFTFPNGSQTISGLRKNNRYQDGYANATFGWKTRNNGKLRLGYQFSDIQQELPGAVILYNSTADEQLFTRNHTVLLDFSTRIKKKWLYRIHSNWNWNAMRYFDPTYLNQQGFLESKFLNRSVEGGVLFHRLRQQKFDLTFGGDMIYSNLKSKGNQFDFPQRLEGSLVAKARFFIKKFEFWGQTGVRLIVDENTEKRNWNQFNPSGGITHTHRKKWLIKNGIHYINSFRLPTFNELYYGQIGNADLRPEKAHQLMYKLIAEPLRGKLSFGTNLYFNRVEDKIVAIPNKNLFVWTILNVDKVDIFGGDVALRVRIPMKKHLKLSIYGNYTYQKVVDKTPNSPTFGHQVAYTPKHIVNGDVSFYWKTLGIRVSNFWVSSRYALNQNIPVNLVDGFYTMDLGVFYTLQLPKKNILRMQFTLKNVFNQSFSYVRSFVMPRRNFLISINYAFN